MKKMRVLNKNCHKKQYQIFCMINIWRLIRQFTSVKILNMDNVVIHIKSVFNGNYNHFDHLTMKCFKEKLHKN